VVESLEKDARARGSVGEQTRALRLAEEEVRALREAVAERDRMVAALEEEVASARARARARAEAAGLSEGGRGALEARVAELEAEAEAHREAAEAAGSYATVWKARAEAAEAEVEMLKRDRAEVEAMVARFARERYASEIAEVSGRAGASSPAASITSPAAGGDAQPPPGDRAEWVRRLEGKVGMLAGDLREIKAGAEAVERERADAVREAARLRVVVAERENELSAAEHGVADAEKRAWDAETRLATLQRMVPRTLLRKAFPDEVFWDAALLDLSNL